MLAGLLDEGLEAITLLWSGEPVTFHGKYVTVDDVVMKPTPVQRPRVPIFVGGFWPNKAPARRAARWDGSILNAGNEWGQPPDADILGPLADAGATWWDECFPIGRLDKFDLVRARIEEGPPPAMTGAAVTSRAWIAYRIARPVHRPGNDAVH